MSVCLSHNIFCSLTIGTTVGRFVLTHVNGEVILRSKVQRSRSLEMKM